ncbi:MAG: HAD-IIB family hydrolase [Acidimicrobiales bacterium]|nr:HAD-IIB family hydrolase [Acidimicrobiales bacterium]
MLPLICLDVDGTLVGSAGEPSEALWRSAEAARGRGQRLTLCTARLAAGPTRGWAERLDPDGWHVFHTGAVRWHPVTGEVRTEALTVGEVELCAEAGERNGWVVETYTWDDYAVEVDHPLAVAHAGLLDMPFRMRHRSDLEGEIVRMQFVVPIEDCDRALTVPLPGLDASAATSPVMPDAAFVSITRAGVSKASGVAAVAHDLGVDMADVMMVGDGHNDLPAIETVGWGVAMSNAAPELHKAARLVVADVDDDGAAEAIDRSAGLI